MTSRIFGHIAGYVENTIFESRRELSEIGIHRPTMAGISGTSHEGADSIVVSGGYEDDDDQGNEIVYTGHGGRDPNSGEQIADQLLMRGNAALAYSCTHGLPVRVVRGAAHASVFAPARGYRYDGLYRVADYWHDRGQAGFLIWRFRLCKLDASLFQPTGVFDAQGEAVGEARRQQITYQRIIRDTQQGREVKALYDYHCQGCEIRLEGSAGPYAEAAHIRPLGRPHNGPDTRENLLCLCPNHHVLLDYGGFAITDSLTILGSGRKLIVKQEHKISVEHIRYHRNHYAVRH